MLEGWRGTRGAGQGMSGVEFASTVSGLFAGVNEGSGEKSGISLRQSGGRKI